MVRRRVQLSVAEEEAPELRVSRFEEEEEEDRRDWAMRALVVRMVRAVR